jgi:aryl-alcohol dehydrogenase-like predicted oxidoreductase
LERMKLDYVDVFFLHNWVTTDGAPTYDRGTPRSSVESAVIPAMERIVASGRARAWGLTGIGDPAVLVDMLDSGIRPDFIQIMANLLDSPGGLKYPDGPAQPRNIIAAAQRAGASIMGIRAVQAGALTSEIDRFKPADNPETLDFQRAAPFRAIAAEVGLSPAFLAHQYALSMDGPATVVLGVKNRTELRECIAAEAAGPMDPGLIQRIDQAVGRMD